MFWIGLAITVVAGLLGVSLWRSWIQSRFHLGTDRVFDITTIGLIVIGAVIAATDFRQSEHEKQALQKDIAQTRQEVAESRQKQVAAEQALRDHSSVARLNPVGLTGVAGAGLKETSPISEALEGAWIERDGKLFPRCDPLSLAKFRQVAGSSPRFPWSHYGLAACLRVLGDGSWRSYAQQAVEILDITTLLAGHHPSHAEGLRELRGYLNAPENERIRLTQP